MDRAIDESKVLNDLIAVIYTKHMHHFECIIVASQ